MNFGSTLSQLRKAKNVTQEEMAAELGVTAAAVSKWENNYTLPDILMLCALADYFDVTTDELLGRKSEKKSAVIASQTQELGRKIEILAKQHGIAATAIYQDYDQALSAVNADCTVNYLIVCYHDGDYFDDCSVPKLVSVYPTEQQILAGLNSVLETLQNMHHRLDGDLISHFHLTE